MKTAIVIAALAAFSTPALAGEIHIGTSGKDLRAIRAEVRKAAEVICDQEVAAYPWHDADRDGCVEESYRDGMAQLKRLTRRTKLASAAPSPPPGTK